MRITRKVGVVVGIARGSVGVMCRFSSVSCSFAMGDRWEYPRKMDSAGSFSRIDNNVFVL